MEDNEVRDISRLLIEESNHHAGSVAELLEGAASEIDILRDEKADLRTEIAQLKAELSDAKRISAATIGHQGSLLEAATGRAETAESGLTRARAEGMAEGARTMRARAANAMRQFHSGKRGGLCAAVIMSLPLVKGEQ